MNLKIELILKTMNDQFHGLLNYGNTCFINSIIQILGNSEIFTSNLSLIQCDMKTYLQQCYESNSPNRILNFINYVKKIKKQYNSGEQQDAHEFLLFLLDTLDAQTTQPSTKKTRSVSFSNKSYDEILRESSDLYWNSDLDGKQKIITDFQGQFRSIVTCVKCHRERNSWNLFSNLSIFQNVDRLSDYFNNNIGAKEIISDYDCSQCKCSTTAEKNDQVWRLPHILVIHCIEKNLKQINLSMKLNDYASGQSKYTLKGICFHEGSTLYSGHYFSALRTTTENTWCITNDSIVKTCRTDFLKKFIPNIYILLYERK